MYLTSVLVSIWECLCVNWHGKNLYVAHINYLSLSLLGFICVWMVGMEMGYLVPQEAHRTDV